MWGELHEVKEVIASLASAMDAGKGNRLFRELGATLHYDVYGFNALKNEIWQSESVLNISLLLNGVEVDAQEDFDEIRMAFPLATRPSSDQSPALELMGTIIHAFGATATYQGEAYSTQAVQDDWDACTSYLLKEWGEEPGSESLRRMIEESHA